MRSQKGEVSEMPALLLLNRHMGMQTIGKEKKQVTAVWDWDRLVGNEMQKTIVLSLLAVAIYYRDNVEKGELIETQRKWSTWNGNTTELIRHCACKHTK